MKLLKIKSIVYTFKSTGLLIDVISLTFSFKAHFRIWSYEAMTNWYLKFWSSGRSRHWAEVLLGPKYSSESRVRILFQSANYQTDHVKRVQELVFRSGNLYFVLVSRFCKFRVFCYEIKTF